MKAPITVNVYGGGSAQAYRTLADNVERFPNDTHRVQPFLPDSDEVFVIDPPENAGFVKFLRDVAAQLAAQ